MKHIRIVAEIGCNLNGDKRLARKMIAAAKECGVDAVKFQTFNAQNLISIYAPKADYQKETTGEDVWKIPSGEITNLPFLERIGKIKAKDKRVLVSTGMAAMDEIPSWLPSG